MTPDSPKRQYVSDWWWRAPILASLTAQTVLLATDTQRTTAGHTIQAALCAAAIIAIIVSSGVDWALKRRHRKATEQEPREGIGP